MNEDSLGVGVGRAAFERESVCRRVRGGARGPRMEEGGLGLRSFGPSSPPL